MIDVQSESTRIAAAGSEPLSLDEAKLWLHVDTTDDDDLITGLCSAARQYAEKFCRRSFVSGEQWKLSLDHFPFALLGEGGFQPYALSALWNTPGMYLLGRPRNLAIELPQSPVSMVNVFSYTDPTGAVQTLPSTAYTLVPDDDANALLYPAYETGWPATQVYPEAVQVLYTTGAAPDVLVVLAMKQLVAHWYANRESVVMVPGVTPVNVPLAAEMLLWPYRNFEF